ncbi:MAG: GGDEF domain-containing protein [Thermodesulfobacteriota bacterium]
MTTTENPDLSTTPPVGAPEHSWLSNPLDWPPIDRVIFLAWLVLLSPVGFGIGLLAFYVLLPDWFNGRIAVGLLSLYGAHAAALIYFILAAFRRRRRVLNWPLMENFVLGSFFALSFIESWLSGQIFTVGILLVVSGISIAFLLADIRKLQLAYLTICVAFIVFAFLELSGYSPYAPLFIRPPYHADGSPLPGWFALQVTLSVIMLGILYIALVAAKRWGSREDLYREMSNIDGLTRLTNRRSFIEISERELLRTQRNPVAMISCIMVDIDHFKSINDTYGHPAGDAMLVQVARTLRENAREYDEVGRYGGEEFAVLLPMTTLDKAVNIAERQRARIAETEIIIDGRTIRVTASFGVACLPAAGIGNINDLLKAADEALYHAKQSGRNQVVTADSSSSRPVTPSGT